MAGDLGGIAAKSFLIRPPVPPKLLIGFILQIGSDPILDLYRKKIGRDG